MTHGVRLPRRFVVPVAALVVLTLAPHVAAAADWELIEDDEGIRVWRREVEGTSLVEFRGRGVVDAPIQAVLAVVHDADRSTEWMENCNASHTIQYKSPLDVISYNRTASPAPLVSDRDVVVESTYEITPAKRTIKMAFRSVTHPKAPAIDGVVRMPRLEGYFELTYLTPTKTDVTYQIQADPGGSLPSWIVNWASKSIPFDTIRNLRKQVSQSGYEKVLHVLEMAIDFAAITSTAAKR
ncbi:START domain-containing protein [Myxococcota bacterium]|nr:START domain-containing protein [Myxococcota bacterium]